MKNSFVAYGGSMSPLINKGDVIHIKEGRMKIGDVVLFVQNKKAIVHRVIWKLGSRVWTKGDSVLILDDEIKESDILGIVFRIEARGKDISFNKLGVQIVQAYLLVRSIIICVTPGSILKMLLGRLLGGRRVLVKLVS